MDRIIGILMIAAFLFPTTACGRPRSTPSTILEESWKAYVEGFVQHDGRVIDHKGGGISTSEGQAYTMLRAAWMGDRPTFDKAFTWALNNLNYGVRNDHLWAWKWGRDTDGEWRVLDTAFASDADQDAAFALVLASETWNEPRYLEAARSILADLWQFGTIAVGGRRYLLAGDSLCTGSQCRLNPSYAAPYAYRVFQRYDGGRNWRELVDSSYFLLSSASSMAQTRLPPDWITLNVASGELRASEPKDAYYSYDAFRTHWRVALDAMLYEEPRAESYLRESLGWIASEWSRSGRLPAAISPAGEPRADYESLEMLAGLMPAMKFVSAETADALHRKLQSTYSNGIWAEKDSYYIQNWAWFGTALYGSFLTPLEKLTR